MPRTDPQELSLDEALELATDDLHVQLQIPGVRERLEEEAKSASADQREEWEEALRFDGEFPWFTDPPAPPKKPPSPPAVTEELSDLLSLPREQWGTLPPEKRLLLDEALLPPALPWPDDPQGEADRIEALVQKGEPVGIPNGKGLIEQSRSDRFPMALKREVLRLVEAADFPDERSDAVLNRAARLIDGAVQELTELEPFGTIISTKQYIAGDYTVRLRETDGRGKVREQIIGEVSPEDFAPGAPMEPVAPTETGLGAPDKNSNVTIQPEDASGLTAEQWLGLPEDARENLLRGQPATVKVK